MYGIYQVSPNDTLENIADTVGTTVDNLKKLNGIMTDMILRPSSFLIVPKYDSNYEKYIVKKGDNMYSIAKNYGINYQSLLKLNGLDEEDYIYPNEAILIPKGFNAYITENETIEEIARKLNIPIEMVISKNPNLMVVEDQVIKY